MDLDDATDARIVGLDRAAGGVDQGADHPIDSDLVRLKASHADEEIVWGVINAPGLR